MCDINGQHTIRYDRQSVDHKFRIMQKEDKTFGEFVTSLPFYKPNPPKVNYPVSSDNNKEQEEEMKRRRIEERKKEEQNLKDKIAFQISCRKNQKKKRLIKKLRDAFRREVWKERRRDLVNKKSIIGKRRVNRCRRINMNSKDSTHINNEGANKRKLRFKQTTIQKLRVLWRSETWQITESMRALIRASNYKLRSERSRKNFKSRNVIYEGSRNGFKSAPTRVDIFEKGIDLREEPIPFCEELVLDDHAVLAFSCFDDLKVFMKKNLLFNQDLKCGRSLNFTYALSVP
uniref:Uncharacterized protein n=1 Tax=Caenorhabditis japonica TaxID=281687 RepID=A0A8R1E5R2_CAEJA